MQINSETIKKNRGWIIKYLLIVMGAVAAPLIGKGIAPLFDWVTLTWSGKAELRGLFAELTTALLWLLGIIITRKVFKKLGEKKNLTMHKKSLLSLKTLPRITIGMVNLTKSESITSLLVRDW